jgi:outer membrane protein
MNSMRRALTVLLFCLICVPAIAWGQEAIKIGYVDLQRALNESEAGKKAKESFKTEVDHMEQSLEKRKSEVEKLKDELEKKGLLLREEERDTLERDYRQKLRDFERLYKDSQQELQIKDRDMTGRILEELRQVIQGMGEQGNYTVILEGNNTVVLYGAKAIDLTDTVIKAYNQKGTKISSKAGSKTSAAD